MLAGIVVELVYLHDSPISAALVAYHVGVVHWVVHLLAQLAPVVLLPIFYKFEPLDNEDLRRRLVLLSEHAGTRVRGVYRWKLSEKSKKSERGSYRSGQYPADHPGRYPAG